MAMIATAEIDKASAEKLFAQMQRAQRELGKSGVQSLQWAMRLVCESLGAATKVSAKRRKVVQNPDDKWMHDKRRAPFGTMAYKNGVETFVPIYRTGEFGKYRFFDTKTMSWYDRRGGSGKWVSIKSGPDIANPEIIVPAIKDSKRLIIKRSGLAKKVWQRAQQSVTRGGSVDAMGISRLATVDIFRSETAPVVTLRNKLRYANDAFESGRSAVSHAVEMAARKLTERITQEAEKRLVKAAA